VELIYVIAVSCATSRRSSLTTVSFYDLPRKFNIAFDGGGLYPARSRTRMTRCEAVKSAMKSFSVLRLGGATGPKRSPATSASSAASRSQQSGCRGFAGLHRARLPHDRKKARLKHLLEKIDVLTNIAPPSKRNSANSSVARPTTRRRCAGRAMNCRTPHVGDFPQKQRGFKLRRSDLSVGQITPKQMCGSPNSR